MTIVYVSRDALGRITGVYARRQPGRAEEPLVDSDAEVRRFVDPADTSIHRRAGAGRRARQFAAALERDPLEALVTQAKETSR